MKRFILTISFAATSTIVFSQWVSGGGYSTTTNRVSIGPGFSNNKYLLVEAPLAFDHIVAFSNTDVNNGFGLFVKAKNDPIRVLSTNAGWNDLFVIKSNGNVGINTNNPLNKFEINTQGAGAFNIFGNNSSWVGADINIVRSSSSTSVGTGPTIQLNDNGPGGSFNIIQGSVGGLQFFNKTTGSWFERMRIAPNGFVGIGTPDPDDLLTVKGAIHAKEVRLDLEGPLAVPDYVFEPDYNLPSLSEVESYIKANKHLPEVPSAKEMEAEGMNLKEMNLLLLKKVEELTLHLIEMNQKLQDQQNQIDKLKK